MAFPIFSLIEWKKVPTAQYIHTVGSVPSARITLAHARTPHCGLRPCVGLIRERAFSTSRTTPPQWGNMPTAQHLINPNSMVRTASHQWENVPKARYLINSSSMVRTVLQQWENVPTARHSINPTQTQCSVGWESAHLQKSVLEARHRQTRQDTYSNDNPPIA